MRPVNKVALVLVAAASVLSVLEFVSSVQSGGSPTGFEQRPAAWLVQVVHLAAEAGILAVLLRNARAIDAGRRSRTVLRLVLVVALAAYVVFLTVLTLLVPEIGDLWRGPAGGWPWWFDVMRAVGAVGLVLPWVLGITMLVQGDRSVAARLLAVAALVQLASLLLLPLVLGHSWAALPLGGVLTSIGLALLGARVPADAPARSEPSATE